MLTLALVLVGSYLLGSIPFGYLAGRIRGIDIRKAGSGNIGATNVVRVLGKAYGYPVFVLDFLKGLGAVRISIAIATSVRPESTSPEVVGILAAGLMPLATLIGVGIWILTFFLTRYVSVASVTTAVALPLVIAIMTWLNQTYGKALFYSSLCIAAVVIWRHHSNLSRLIRGTEPRFTRK